MIELHGKLSVKRLSGMVNLVHVKASDDMLQAKTVTPSTSQQVVTPDTGSGYTALSRVTVEAVALQNKTVKPGSAAQAVQADDGSTGLGIVTVEAAPLQEITAEIAAEIQHLTPDEGFYGFSGVTIKALPDAETAAFCESVELPAIPADVLESYPYAIITEADGGDTTMYVLAAAESAFFYIVSQSNDKYLGSAGAGTTYYTTAEGTSWTKLADQPAGDMAAEMTEDSRVVYSNHDIYQVEADDDGSLSVDILYYAKSGLYGVAISDAYRIQRDTMEDLGDQVNRLTGTAESMTPGRMTQKLEGLNIQLQELTVTATEEKQTITPPSGVYGFSKVIVEAVEDSGSSGGGGTGEGGEGGDTGENYVDSNHVAFGNEYIDIPAAVEDNTRPYKVIIRNINNGVTTLCASTKHYYHQAYNSWGNIVYQVSTDGLEKAYTLDGSAWGTEGERYLAIRDDTFEIIFTSHDITEGANGTEIWMNGMEPVSDDVSVRIPTALERDETYTIEGEKLNDLIGAVQGLTGSDEPMTPDEAIEALGDYGTRPAAEEASF